MITSYLQGGLGNQLFQISAAIALSVDNNDQAIFDTSAHDLPKQGRRCENYLKTIFRNINFSSNLSAKHIYREPNFSYNKIFYRPDTCLVGYFQSEKYFAHHSDFIRETFSVDEDTKSIIYQKYGNFLKNKTVAVHVRRGDYLKYSNSHPPCTLEYYNEALKCFGDDFTFLFFSDDIGWCKQEFVRDNFHFINDNEDVVDFYLISLCDNAIISNSSFSWWASWLNKNKEKKVIAPKNWFGPEIKHSTKDLIPLRWKII